MTPPWNLSGTEKKIMCGGSEKAFVDTNNADLTFNTSC